MITAAASDLPVPNAPEQPRRKRRRLRWTVADTAYHAKLAPQFGISLDTRRLTAGPVRIRSPRTDIAIWDTRSPTPFQRESRNVRS